MSLLRPGANRPLLRCGLLPGESSAMVMQRNEPLRQHLSRLLGIDVELVVGKTYAATGEALRRGQIDIAYLGPVTYILQSRYVALEPFARPCHAGSTGPTFKSVIIVPASSPAQSLADLRGQEVALGDLASTSGTWVPRHLFLEQGLVADRDYRRRHLGNHDAVAQAVAQHKAAAGALHRTVYQCLLDEGRLPANRVRILAESPPIPEYMWTFRAGLDPLLREDLREAFTRLRHPEALQAYRAQSFIPAVDADVDRVRHWMEGILQARLLRSDLESAEPRDARATVGTGIRPQA